MIPASLLTFYLGVQGAGRRDNPIMPIFLTAVLHGPFPAGHDARRRVRQRRVVDQGSGIQRLLTMIIWQDY